MINKFNSDVHSLILAGYITPVEDPPCLVDPVWRSPDGSEAVAFRDSTSQTPPPGVTLELIGREAEWSVTELGDEWDDRSIEGLGPLEVGLMILSKELVVGYPISEEKTLASALLDDPNFCATMPYKRLAFSKVTEDSTYIGAELAAAFMGLLIDEITYTDQHSRKRVEEWLATQKRSLEDSLGGIKDSSRIQELQQIIPTRLEQSSATNWWRQYLAPSRRGRPQRLSEIEDRTPSPRLVFILGSQPKVPEDEVVSIMARHLQNATEYRFLHSEEADPAEFERILHKVAAAVDRMIERERREKTLVSRIAQAEVDGEQLAQRQISFYELEADWTGSPYVFYFLEGVHNQLEVEAFRGLEAGSALAELYVGVSEEFGRELLEAMWMKVPSKVSAVPHQGNLKRTPFKVLDGTRRF